MKVLRCLICKWMMRSFALPYNPVCLIGEDEIVYVLGLNFIG